MRYLLLIIFTFFLTVSCIKEQDTQLQENTATLISYFVDKLSHPLPPPPPLKGEMKLSKEVIDSLMRIKLNIAIYPIMSPIMKRNFKLGEYNSYSEIIDSSFLIKDNMEIPLYLIKSKKGHKLVKADTLLLRKTKDWREYDLLFNISRISFNKDYSKAICMIGISRSALWGHGGLYLFEKDDEDKWKIVKYFQIEEW